MSKRHSADTLAIVCLLLLFLLTGALALIAGARSWQSTDAAMARRLDRQIPFAYIAGKARQSDSLTAEPFGEGGTALVLGSEWDGERYETRLYCLDGQLCELFSPAGVTLHPSDGTAVAALQDLSLEMEDGAVRVSLTAADGATAELLLAPRRGEGADA